MNKTALLHEAKQQQQAGGRPDRVLQGDIGEQTEEQNEIGTEIEKPVPPLCNNR